MIDGFQIGQLVYSKAGRDAGRPLLVVGLIGDRYVLVADGEGRRADSPKRKNVRHLQPTHRVHEGLAARIRAGERLSDQDLRAALAELAPPGREVAGDRE